MRTDPVPSDAATEQTTLPIAALVALAMAGFISIVTETLPAGLLPQLAQGMGISEVAAGQFVTIYAIGSLAAALPLVSLTQSWPRKPLLIAAVGGLSVLNLATALSHDIAFTMVVRFLAGICAGLSWGMLGGVARRMVVEPLKGRALAVAMAGTPVALSIGVPLGTFVGEAVGWRLGFGVLSLLAAALVGYILRTVPNLPGQSRARPISIGAVLNMPGVRPVMATALAWITAHYIVYTYIAPLTAWIGFGQRVDLVLLAFGCASIGGIALAGTVVDRGLRTHVLASIVAFAVAMVVIGLMPGSPIALGAAILVWGATFGGAATLLQTAASDAAGEGVDIVGAMLTTVWNGAIAVGGILGGLLYERNGAGALPPASFALIAIAFVIAVLARRHGFVKGPRQPR